MIAVSKFSHGLRLAAAVGTLIGLALVLIAPTRVFAADPDPAAPKRPDVVLILVDTLRADRLTCYGHPEEYTPVMDGIASESVVFERAIAPAPWTLPAVGSIFTGVYPSVHHVNNARNRADGGPHSPNIVYGVPAELTTLAESLRDAGYRTAAFSANEFVAPKNGFGQGFEYFDSSVRRDAPGSRVNEAALRWLSQQDRSKPIFLYLHYMDVHAPYTARPGIVDPMLARLRAKASQLHPVQGRWKGIPPLSAELRQKPDFKMLGAYVEFWSTCYDAGVRQMDEYLGDLVASLKQQDRWKESIIVLMADHGEALCEHDIWGHGDSLYQNELHVPLMIRWRGHLPARRIAETVSGMDVFPTLLDLLSIDVPPDIQAASAANLIRTTVAVGRPVMAEGVKKFPQRQAYVDGTWKILGDADAENWQLFDLRKDPLERINLASQYQKRTRGLVARLLEQRGRNLVLSKEYDAKGAELTPEEVARLKAIGYLGGPDENEDENATGN